jgi:ubiquinone/menaquinone biosynthesis C-methylase UbiE
MTDYDVTNLPAGYDRARDHGPEVLDLWMRTVAKHVERPVRRILDLGCGTGRFSHCLASQFNAEVIGLDPSSKMLQVARAKQGDPRVHYELGRAEAVPLANASVDLIFVSMSLHHFTDRTLAALECRRVLSDHGTVVVRTGTREQIQHIRTCRFFYRPDHSSRRSCPEVTT